MYLTSPEADLSWIQLNMVDCYAFLFSVAAVTLTLLGWLLWTLGRLVWRRLGSGHKVKSA